MSNSKLKSVEQLTSPIDLTVLNIIGGYLLIVLFLCITVNLALIYVFVRFERTRTGLNKFILVMGLFNMFGSIQLPFTIISHFSHRWIYFVKYFKISYFKLKKRWIWSKTSCIIFGFVNYFTCCMQVYLVSAITIVCFDVLNRKLNVKSISNRVIMISTAISLVLSLFWSLVPLFGWSFYSFEENRVSCSVQRVDYNEKSINVITYNAFALVVVYIVPFAVILFLGLKSILIVKVFRFVCLILI